MIANPTTPMVAPIGCSVRVEMNSPIAPNAARHTTTYPQTSSNRHSPTAVDTCVPESNVTGPAPNSTKPSTTPTTAISSTATMVPINSALFVAWSMNPPPPPEPLDLTANPMMIGTAASTASPAMFRRRRKINRSSERRKRNDGPLDGAAGSGRAISSADTETLPGQGDEDVLQVDRHRTEGPHRHAVVDQRRDDRRCFRRAELGGDPTV